jgi:ribosomal silencing factor RsfS
MKHRPEGRQFAEHHHLNPGVQMHQQIQALAHGLDVIVRGDRHLNAGDGKRCHSDWLLTDIAAVVAVFDP